MAREVIKSENAPSPAGPYSQGITADKFVFVSGQVGRDLRSGTMPETIEEQTRQALTNIDFILRAAGSSLMRAVKIGVFLRDIADFNRMNEAYNTFFPENPPARTTIQAVLPGKACVEIDCVALNE